MVEKSKCFLNRSGVIAALLVCSQAVAGIITDDDITRRPIVKMKESLVNTGVLRMALTSHELGFKGTKKDRLVYRQFLNHLLLNRAQEFCEADGYLGLAGTPETEEILESFEEDGKVKAEIPRYNEATQQVELRNELFLREKRWRFRSDNGIPLTVVGSFGVILGGGFPVAMIATGAMAVTATAVFAPVMLALNAASVVGLWVVARNDSILCPDEAKQRQIKGLPVYERSSTLGKVFKKKVPHLAFSSIPCSNDPNQVDKFWYDFDEKERTSDTPWVSRKSI